DFPNLERLDCDTNKLAGLKVINCPKLKTIYCYSNQLSDLDLNNLPRLKFLSCFNNCLDNLDFLNNLNSEKLTTLDVRSNNLPKQNLKVFSQFPNLKTLKIGNDNKGRIERGDYVNRFYGSLEPLKKLTK